MINGKISVEDIEAAKSYALGRYQMGSQTVDQISRFYTNRYFSDGFIKDYAGVPAAILAVTDEKIVQIAREFFAANTWALAGLSCGDKDLIIKLNDKLVKLFQ